MVKFASFGLILLLGFTGIHAQTAASSPRIYRTYQLTDGVWIKTFTVAGNSLYSAHQNRQVKEWSVVNGTVRRTFGDHPGDIACIKVVGNYLFVGSDSTIAQWSLVSGQQVRTLSSPYANITEFESDGTYLFSKTVDGKLVQWDVDMGTLLRNFSSSATQRVWNSQGTLYYIEGANINSINPGDGTSRTVYTDPTFATTSFQDSLDAIGDEEKVYRLNRVYNTTSLSYGFQVKRVTIGAANPGQDSLVYSPPRRVSQMTLTGDALLWKTEDDQYITYFDTKTNSIVGNYSFDKKIMSIAVNPASPSFVFAVVDMSQIVLFRLFKSDGSALPDSSTWVTAIQPPPPPARVLSGGEIAWITVVSIVGTILIGSAVFWVLVKTKSIRQGYRNQVSQSALNLAPSSKQLPMAGP